MHAGPPRLEAAAGEVVGWWQRQRIRIRRGHGHQSSKLRRGHGAGGRQPTSRALGVGGDPKSQLTGAQRRGQAGGPTLRLVGAHLTAMMLRDATRGVRAEIQQQQQQQRKECTLRTESNLSPRPAQLLIGY